ncbi:MAG TPA: futalosine hydrolase [Frankiaceae bacterium]|nr:futalosine hydrolase [Frankiaceae bacterium]
MTPGGLLVVTAVNAERDAIAKGLGAGEQLSVGPYEALRGRGVTIVAGGVGPAAAAAATATALSLSPSAYALAVSAGIAGGFAGRVAVGDVVEATLIVAADLGADSPDGFLTLDALGFGSGEIVAEPLGIGGARRGPVLTVSTVTGSEARATELAARGGYAEAMEGFGVAEAASRRGVPVAELRAISNQVGLRAAAAWDIPGALAALSSAARELSGVLS